MRHSTDRILCTHAGRLSSSLREFETLDQDVWQGKQPEDQRYLGMKNEAIAHVVDHQLEIGIDVISDGELGRRRDFPYYSKRMSGIELRDLKEGEVGATVFKSRERDAFPGYYSDADSKRASVARPQRIVCSGPLESRSLDVLHDEIATFKAALAGKGEVEAFFPVIAPGWLDHFIFNEYYNSDEDFIEALSEVMRPEYEAVVKAGLIVQIDDPGLADSWPTLYPKPSIDGYRRYAKIRVDALNHALRNIAADRIRYHCCWGSWVGPHSEDLPLKHIVDLMLSLNIQAYSVEAGNVQHEHEWRVWEDIKLPEGKILIPGVVSHKTEVVEHPELVAERLVRYANCVGRENVQAGTDCGMGLGRVHYEIGWAKIAAMVEGAKLASEKLW
ncbi:MAG: epoxyalkane--coenzyme transferase [Sphingomonas bacterium]|jgi:5-methyltetrahydropteroyltriglutamate--homocysteine methyltransferase|nr:epoxyalkane--coenzyme transferase [Sphingomonas bacterium]